MVVPFANEVDFELGVVIDKLLDFGGHEEGPDSSGAASVVAKVKGKFGELVDASGTHQ